MGNKPKIDLLHKAISETTNIAVRKNFSFASTRIFTLIILFLLIGCGGTVKLERDIRPGDILTTSALSENCAYFFDQNFEISIEEIDEKSADQILVNNISSNKRTELKSNSLPKLNLFRIIISNTGEISLGPGKVSLNYGNTYYPELNDLEIKNDKYLFNSGLDFRRLSALYKTDIDDVCADEVDYKEMFRQNSAEKIEPGTSAIKIIVFKWIPVEIRKFTVKIEIKSDIIQKIVDFKLKRFEYRKSGDEFIKPAQSSYD